MARKHGDSYDTDEKRVYTYNEQLNENFSLALPNDIHNNAILKKFQQLSKELNVCLPVSNQY